MMMSLSGRSLSLFGSVMLNYSKQQ
jgi:DNA-binding CsgD family transcriptional regulator